MGKLRVGHLHTDAEQTRALAQELLVAADEYEQMAGYDQITVLTTRVSTLNRADDYVDCDGRGLTTKFAKSVLAEP
jgi:hypothetical protein